MGTDASDIRRLISVVREPSGGVRILGNGLLAPPVLPLDAWLARYGGPQAHLPASPDLSPLHEVGDRAPRVSRG